MSEPELPFKPVQRTRSFVILPISDSTVKNAKHCEVVVEGAALKVLQDEALLGISEKPPASVLEEVQRAGGRMAAELQQYRGPDMPCRVAISLSA